MSRLQPTPPARGINALAIVGFFLAGMPAWLAGFFLLGRRRIEIQLIRLTPR